MSGAAVSEDFMF